MQMNIIIWILALLGVVFIVKEVLMYFVKYKSYRTNPTVEFLSKYNNDIIELAKESSWIWLQEQSEGKVSIEVLDNLNMDILSDITVKAFFEKIESSGDTLRYISDEDVYTSIADIITIEYIAIIQYCEKKVKELDELEKIDITKPEKKIKKENYPESSLFDAINMFYNDDDTSNDV